MANFSIHNIREITYSVGNLDKALHFFVNYGGWELVEVFESNREMLTFWGLPTEASAKEVLLRCNGKNNGQIRLIAFENIEQDYIRSSQQPWDTGGIMDINLRVNKVSDSFNELREMGWHGLSDPLLQVMGPFKLYDILMKGYDDTIIAFTHRLEPPMEDLAPIKLPSHVYNSSLVVKDLKKSRSFFVDQLGCQLLNEYEVKKDAPQENMFGLPFNFADKVTCKANILSFDGQREVLFQIIEFEGVTGKDFSQKAKPPNRGFMSYRVEITKIEEYYQELKTKTVNIQKELKHFDIQPYGTCKTFAVLSPDGVWITFFEKIN